MVKSSFEMLQRPARRIRLSPNTLKKSAFSGFTIIGLTQTNFLRLRNVQQKNMCMVYYLGTDGNAPRIAWSESRPAFYVSDVEADVVAAIRAKLPHQNLVYLGSHEGCGCGFRRADEYTEDESSNSATAEDHRALVTYLTNLPPSTRPPQIFGCWSGDEGATIDHRREISPSAILDTAFGFQEREILTLKQK